MIFVGGQSRALPLRGWGRKRTGLINQIFIRSVFMRSRVKRGNKIVLAYSYGGMQKGDTRKQKGDTKEIKREMQKEREKKKKKQAVSAIIRESSAFWERPKRTGVKRRVKA